MDSCFFHANSSPNFNFGDGVRQPSLRHRITQDSILSPQNVRYLKIPNGYLNCPNIALGLFKRIAHESSNHCKAC